MKRSQYIVFSIVILSISLVISVLVAESIVRLFHLAPPIDKQYRNYVQDTHLPYKPKPLSVSLGRSSADEFDYEYRHNSFGFRDFEYAYEKNDSTFRILGLGDSFTYGSGVRFRETYLYRLEEMLNSRIGNHPKIEIIKAGISKYFPQPERILLEKYGINYSPNLVLVGFIPNDVIDTYLGINAVVIDKSGYMKSREAKDIGTLGIVFYKKSHLFRLVLKCYIDYQFSKKYQIRMSEVFKENGFYEKEWQEVEHEYYNILSIARAINSHVIFVNIPQKPPWNETHFYPSKRLAKWTRENNTGFIDILPSMVEASGRKSLYYEIDGHCTSDGYEVIALAIYKYLTENGIVP